MEVPEGGVASKPLTEDELNANLDKYDKPNPRIPLPDVDEFMALPPAEFVTLEDLKHREEQKRNSGRNKGGNKRQQKQDDTPNPASTENKNAEAPAPLYRSPAIKSGSGPRLVDIDVDLKNARDLYLVVSDEGDRSHDWSNWLETTVHFADGTSMALTELDWASAKSTGQTRVGKNYDGGVLTVENKSYQNGIGAHAPSTIHYRLPKAASRLTGKVGIDDGGAIRGGKPTPAEVRFLVYSAAPPASATIPAANKAPGFDPNNLEPQKVPADQFTVADDLEVTVWAPLPCCSIPPTWTAIPRAASGSGRSQLSAPRQAPSRRRPRHRAGGHHRRRPGRQRPHFRPGPRA